MSTPITDERLKSIGKMRLASLSQAETMDLFQALRERDAIIAHLKRPWADIEQQFKDDGLTTEQALQSLCKRANGHRKQVQGLERKIQVRDATICEMADELDELKKQHAELFREIVEYPKHQVVLGFHGPHCQMPAEVGDPGNCCCNGIQDAHAQWVSLIGDNRKLRAELAELRQSCEHAGIRINELVDERNAAVAELRKPVDEALVPNEIVERIRGAWDRSRNADGRELLIPQWRHVSEMLSAYDNARDAIAAEMRRLRERLSAETIAANQHFVALQDFRERERKLREALQKIGEPLPTLPSAALVQGYKSQQLAFHALAASPAPVESSILETMARTAELEEKCTLYAATVAQQDKRIEELIAEAVEIQQEEKAK